MNYRLNRHQWWKVDRISILTWCVIILLVIISVRLFQVQVLDFHKYSTYAEERLKGKVITARRGRILLQDSQNGHFELVNNVTLELLFADPSLIDNPGGVASQLAPILFDAVKERYKACGEDRECLFNGLEESLLSEKRFREAKKLEQDKLLNPFLPDPAPRVLTEEHLLREFADEVTAKLAKKERDVVVLDLQVGKETLKAVQDLQLKGVYTTPTSVWANPLEISNALSVAPVLAPVLGSSEKDVAFALSSRPNRYIRLMNRLDFQTAEKIKALRIRGIGFEPEHWRNYSEQEGEHFAGQVLGFLDHQGNPVYGLEKEWDDVLRGKEGLIKGQVDLQGRTLTARSSFIEEAVDGSDLVLSIDHTIQNTIERFLREQVQASRAASGEVLIQDPATGKILAMATFPGFDPNRFGDVYEKEEIRLTPEERAVIETVTTSDGERYFLYYNPGYKIELFKDGDRFLAYKNRSGVGVYRNPIISDIYEPGSTFKSLVMASAIDAAQVQPSDTFKDEGFMDVDCHTLRFDDIVQGVSHKEGDHVCDFAIRNYERAPYGTVTMTQVLEKSLNTGMSFVAKKMGPSLMYDYLKKFGFGEKTYIELPDEEKGKLTHYRNWISESELITKAFGQGIAVTPLQLINAYSAMLNGGILLQPSIIEGIVDHDGTFKPNDPVIVRRVIKQSTSDVIKAMLISSVERGVAQPGAVEGYLVGAKTGTSQIATKGEYESGPGSTYATIAGFGPFEHPRFVVLVKIDRPRDDNSGSFNAAPLFKRVMTFLFQYYQIPPDKEE